MKNNNLQRFEKDGVELVIDINTGDCFYPGYRALARVVSVGLDNPISDVQVKRTIDSLIKGATNQGVQTAEIQTAGGLQGATLIPRQLGTKVIKKYNDLFVLYLKQLFISKKKL